METMESANWILMGVDVAVLLGLVLWKPRREALAVLRLVFMVFQLVLVNCACLFPLLCSLKSKSLAVILAVMPPAWTWLFLILLLKKENKPSAYLAERVVLAVNLAVILFFTFKWVFMYTLQNFFLWLFPLGWMALIFLAALTWAFSYAASWIQRKGRRSLNPLLSCVVTALTVALFPLDDIGRWTNCMAFLLPRESVVREIQSGRLRLEGRRPELSGWRRYLSIGGRVDLQGSGEDAKVMFIDAEGFLSDFSGFIYSGDGKAPVEGDFTIVNSTVQKMTNHWYYAESNN